MLGDERMKDAWQIGTKVAAANVSIVDEGLTPDITGYHPIDDEGVPSQKTYLIKDGILQGRLHSLTTAAELGEAPTGNARAMNFEFEPIVRMTNTYIEPGNQSFDEMIRGIDQAIYLEGVKHGSGLSTFTIAPLRAYWIRNGKIADPVKVSVVSGTVFETLMQIEGLSDGVTIHSSAFGGCGKNDQFPLEISDGGPAIVVSKMQVG